MAGPMSTNNIPRKDWPGKGDRWALQVDEAANDWPLDEAASGQESEQRGKRAEWKASGAERKASGDGPLAAVSGEESKAKRCANSWPTGRGEWRGKQGQVVREQLAHPPFDEAVNGKGKREGQAAREGQTVREQLAHQSCEKTTNGEAKREGGREGLANRVADRANSCVPKTVTSVVIIGGVVFAIVRARLVIVVGVILITTGVILIIAGGILIIIVIIAGVIFIIIAVVVVVVTRAGDFPARAARPAATTTEISLVRLTQINPDINFSRARAHGP